MKSLVGQRVKKKTMVNDGAKRAGMLRKFISRKRVAFTKTSTSDEPILSGL